MSVSYDLICRDCKKSLWIGQSTRCFYFGELHTMKALNEFLFDHVHHALAFEPMEWWGEIPEDWQEIDSNDYREVSPTLNSEPEATPKETHTSDVKEQMGNAVRFCCIFLIGLSSHPVPQLGVHTRLHTNDAFAGLYGLAALGRLL